MWPKNYKDYPEDTPLIHEQVEPGKGIVGCEMHELNGWGETLHIPKKRKKGILVSLLSALFGEKEEHF